MIIESLRCIKRWNFILKPEYKENSGKYLEIDIVVSRVRNSLLTSYSMVVHLKIGSRRDG